MSAVTGVFPQSITLERLNALMNFLSDSTKKGAGSDLSDYFRFVHLLCEAWQNRHSTKKMAQRLSLSDASVSFSRSSSVKICSQGWGGDEVGRAREEDKSRLRKQLPGACSPLSHPQHRGCLFSRLALPWMAKSIIPKDVYKQRKAVLGVCCKKSNSCAKCFLNGIPVWKNCT